MVQIAATQIEAAVALFVIPLDRSGQEPRVRLNPVEVSVDRVDQASEGLAKVALVEERKPVALADRRGHRLVLDRVEQDGHQALIVLDRMSDLLGANLGGNRMDGDDEHKRVGRLDRRVDLALPLRRERDALPIDPDRAIRYPQRIVEASDENGVPAGIGDEEIAHDATSVSRK